MRAARAVFSPRAIRAYDALKSGSPQSAKSDRAPGEAHAMPLKHLTPLAVSLSALSLAACSGGADQTREPDGPPSIAYQVETVAGGLSYPWDIEFLPGGDILVTERTGALRMIRDGALLEDPVENTPEVYAEGQAGLFEVMAGPDFAETGTVFVSYAAGEADANTTVVERARLSRGALVDREVIFEAAPRRGTSSHYGGRMALMGDGTIALTLGDAFELREQAQVLNNHLGTIVRFNPDGSIPEDNPFAEPPAEADIPPLAEIYSYGHRNVQGVAWDGPRGILWAHEHGPQGGDELNIIDPGNNYGWPVVTEGIDYNGARISPHETSEAFGSMPPLYGWSPSIAPSGLSIYRGDLFADWDGDLFVSALAGRAVHRVAVDDPGNVVEEEVLFSERGERYRHVVPGPDGALWLLVDAEDGAVLRVTPRE